MRGFKQTQDPATWEEIPVITDLCLRVQHCMVQATRRALGTMVLQERAWWLNLANLSDREKDDVLDMPIVPEGIFGSALASMFDSSVSLGSPQLPLRLHREKPSRRLLPKPRSLKYLNCQSFSLPHLPCPVRQAGLRSLRPQLQLRRHIPRKLPRPGRRRELPDRASVHR